MNEIKNESVIFLAKMSAQVPKEIVCKFQKGKRRRAEDGYGKAVSTKAFAFVMIIAMGYILKRVGLFHKDFLPDFQYRD